MNDKTNSNLVIEPADFSRPEADSGKPLLQLSPVSTGIALLFVILALAALFMFNARAVRFAVTPAVDNLSIEGTLPVYRLGERYLMLSGTYVVTASLAGYRVMTDTVQVSEEAEQEFAFTMIRLPGIMDISASHGEQSVEGAEVYIDQELVGSTPIRIDGVEAGLRDLYVVHPRFIPYQTEINVEGMRVEQPLSVSLEPAWAMVSVSSLPDQAIITVDDEDLGATPGSVEVIRGEHQLRLQKPGYKSWETRINITAGVNQVLDEVVMIRSDGKLSIRSEPDNVNITVSGTYHGQTPLSIALAPADNYELIATRAGYESLTRALSIRPEEDRSLQLTLKPVTGLVRLNVSPDGGMLFVDGEAAGDPDQTLELTARNHLIRVELPGYASYETEVMPQPGFSQQLNIIMQTEEAARVSAIPQRLSTAQGDILRFILPGSLTMGAGRREPGRRSNEIEKEVELTRPFYLGEKEISNGTFGEFDPGHDSGVLGRALLSEANRPVVNISWDQAVRFCNWLSDKDNLPAAYETVNGSWQLKQPANTGYRLPTEAEWAWAARYAAGEPTRFPWGDNMPPTEGAGNFADESAVSMVPYSIRGYNDKFRGPAPPGTYTANALGIHDLAGNVSEWVHDAYSIDLHRRKLTDPTGPETGEYRVIRGSNYTHGRFSELRWTFRDYGADPRPDVGFRIARYLE